MGEVIAWTTLDDGGTPFRLAATGAGVVAAGWEPDEDAFLAAIRIRRPSAAIVASVDLATDEPARRMIAAAVPVLTTLLRGEPAVRSDRVPVDLSDRPPFDRRALEAVREVGWGETASYGGIAARIGTPRAARAVGGAMGRNPISLLIPCHRIIAGDGTLGGYGGDGWVDRERQRSRKEALLLQEGTTVPRRAD